MTYNARLLRMNPYFNLLKPNGFQIQRFYVLPTLRIYVFCVI